MQFLANIHFFRFDIKQIIPECKECKDIPKCKECKDIPECKECKDIPECKDIVN